MIQVRPATSAARRSGVPTFRFVVSRRSLGVAAAAARAGGCVCRVSVISRQRAPAGARGVLSNRAKRREILAVNVTDDSDVRTAFFRTIFPAETRPRPIAFEGASIDCPTTRRVSIGGTICVAVKFLSVHRRIVARWITRGIRTNTSGVSPSERCLEFVVRRRHASDSACDCSSRRWWCVRVTWNRQGSLTYLTADVWILRFFKDDEQQVSVEERRKALTLRCCPLVHVTIASSTRTRAHPRDFSANLIPRNGALPHGEVERERR